MCIRDSDITILKRRKPISNVPQVSFGSMPNDGGHLLLTNEEKNDLIKKEPNSEKFIRPLISSREYLNGKLRWCIWLDGVNPSEYKGVNGICQRVYKVQRHRENSVRVATNKLAMKPYLFGEIRQPNSDYILIPLTSSENRYYIPFDFINKNSIANNSCSLIPNANLFHFGILTSSMPVSYTHLTLPTTERV